MSRKKLFLSTLFALQALPLVLPISAEASSHREAPFITRHPKVDGTDFYMFRSYEAGRGGYVTLIANYSPLQDAYGGPNYFSLDPDALYEIHLDTNGDAREDLSFQFRFTNTLKDLQVPVGDKKVSVSQMNIGPIAQMNADTLNVRETYTIAQNRNGRRNAGRQTISNYDSGATSFDKPVDNIGNKSIADYAGYAAKHIYNIRIPGCNMPGRVFVGQRKEGFGVNLGEIFDLVNIKAPATAFDPNAENKGLNIVADKNVTSLALELPISCVSSGNEPVIGAWTTASLRQGRLINPVPGSDNKSASKEGGAWTQVSRLGMPLVNEVVIGLKDKDRFNHSQPKDDGQFLTYVSNPTLPTLLEILFSSAGVKAPTNFPRNDLITAFLTGVPGINKPAGVTPAEMLRLNTSTAVADKGKQNRLGVIGGDNAGFPNGRRPGDDVVDIELRVAMGRLCALGISCKAADAPSGALEFTDGALVNDSQFDATFPYLKTPLPGSPFSSSN